MKFALACAWLALAAVSPAAEPSPARLRGTFVQLGAENGAWSREKWEEQFERFRALGLERVYVQWSVAGETAYYPSRRFRPVATAPVPTILDLADRAGMRVHLGLSHDPDYWERIGREAELVEVYLRRLTARSTDVARELAPTLVGRPSFAGWYVAEEIDDSSWLSPGRRDLLVRYLQDVSSSLASILPAPLAVSGFSNARVDPEGLERFWSDLIAAAPVDVLFQDGVGAGKLDLEEAPLYLEAVRRAVEGRGREMGTVVELFRQVGGPPLDGGPFRATAADPARVRRQLEIARGAIGAIGFTVPDYLPTDSPFFARPVR